MVFLLGGEMKQKYDWFERLMDWMASKEGFISRFQDFLFAAFEYIIVKSGWDTMEDPEYLEGEEEKAFAEEGKLFFKSLKIELTEEKMPIDNVLKIILHYFFLIVNKEYRIGQKWARFVVWSSEGHRLHPQFFGRLHICLGEDSIKESLYTQPSPDFTKIYVVFPRRPEEITFTEFNLRYSGIYQFHYPFQQTATTTSFLNTNATQASS